MHFTEELVQKLKDKGVDFVPVTLHIGWGTFRPVEVEDLTKHRMDSENYFISKESSDRINEALSSKEHKVIACGTSAVRVIETSIMASGMSKAGTGWTDKFIFPSYPFKITEGLITNFHRPESTLLMLAADRKSTRLNSSHVAISYAVFCLKKKRNEKSYRGHSE